MPVPPETIQRLANLFNVTISQGALLSQYTRFGIGGPAGVSFEKPDQQSFMEALNIAKALSSGTRNGLSFAATWKWMLRHRRSCAKRPTIFSRFGSRSTQPPCAVPAASSKI